MGGVVSVGHDVRSFYDLVSHGEMRQISVRVAHAGRNLFKAIRNFVWDKCCILKERTITFLPESFVFAYAPERRFLKMFFETSANLRREVMSAFLDAQFPKIEEDRKQVLIQEFIKYPRGDKIMLTRSILPFLAKRLCFYANREIIDSIKGMPTRDARDQMMLSLIPQSIYINEYDEREVIINFVSFMAAISYEERQALASHRLLQGTVYIEDGMRNIALSIEEVSLLMQALHSIEEEQRPHIIGFVEQIGRDLDIGQHRHAGLNGGQVWPFIKFIRILGEIPLAERELFIQHALQLITPEMQNRDRIAICRDLKDCPADERAEYVRRRLAGEVGEREMPAVAAAGMDVHAGNRDVQTRRAMELLREHQGAIAQSELDAAVMAFPEYLDSLEIEPGVKKRAQDALLKPREPGETFGPLLEEVMFSLLGFELQGKEVLGRLWMFAFRLAEPEQTNAKRAMVAALRDSYEFGERVCNPGKTQRLLVAVLQGRLEGVLIDATASERITVHQAIQMFFNVPARQQIAIQEELIVEGERFCNENPLVDREAFLAEINVYADEQGF